MSDTTSDTTTVPGGPGRMHWRDAPGRVRQAIEAQLGSPVVGETSEPGGFSPGMASRLRLADGRRVFAKAASAQLSPNTPDLYRQEISVASRLPATVRAPRLLWSYDDGDWVVLVFDEVIGVSPAQPWRPAELRRVLAAMTSYADALTPSPLDGMPLLVEKLADDMSGWRTLARSRPRAIADGYGEWVMEHLDELAGIEERWPAGADGAAMLHCDVRADNVLLTDDDVVLVDWASACVGAPWVDLVFMLPSVAVAGGPPPESIVAAHELTRSVHRGRVDAVVAALAGYFVAKSLQPPPPGLPTLRAYQQVLGRATLAWLDVRLGLAGRAGA